MHYGHVIAFKLHIIIGRNANKTQVQITIIKWNLFGLYNKRHLVSQSSWLQKAHFLPAISWFLFIYINVYARSHIITFQKEIVLNLPIGAYMYVCRLKLKITLFMFRWDYFLSWQKKNCNHTGNLQLKRESKLICNLQDLHYLIHQIKLFTIHFSSH